MKARWQTREGRDRRRSETARTSSTGARARPSAPSATPTSSAPPSCATASIPELEQTRRGRRGELARAAARRPSMSTEEVTEEDIAEVVAKWTGIPVSRMMEGEVEKLIQMEERLHERVIGQDEAVEAVVERAAPLARRASGPESPDRLVPLPRARPASARPSWPARSPSSCSTPSRRWSGSTCPSTWRSTRWRG